MFLCLSSGSSPRYREDVLRSLSQPWGSILQFRYLKRYLAPGVLEKAQAAKETQTQTIIAYIDQSDPSRAPEIVPCRFASITAVVAVGTAVTLQLELQEFGIADDLAKFNGELKEKSTGNLPAWQGDGETKKVRGHYWLEISADPTTAVRSHKLDDWEKIVAQLAVRSDFKDQGSFYTVVGVNEIPSRSAVSVSKGQYEFRPGKEYELSLYHFYPSDVPLEATLSLSTTSQWLTFTTNPILQLDSRYDLKHARFIAGKPTSKENAWISVMRNAGNHPLPYVDFDLMGLIRGVFWGRLGYGILLGLFVAGPSIVVALSNPSLPASKALPVCLMSAALGVAGGIAAAFGMKKSP